MCVCVFFSSRVGSSNNFKLSVASSRDSFSSYLLLLLLLRACRIVNTLDEMPVKRFIHVLISNASEVDFTFILPGSIK